MQSSYTITKKSNQFSEFIQRYSGVKAKSNAEFMYKKYPSKQNNVSQQIRLHYLKPVIPQISWNCIQEHVKGSLASAKFVLSKPYISTLMEFYFLLEFQKGKNPEN